MPFISIIIPTHNNEEHIEQAILSCFDSDFDDFEVIVINDASTDQTKEKIKKIKNHLPEKIKLITSEQQVGPGPARNLGLEKASGEYLMFLDGDDWFEPNAVKIVAKKLIDRKLDVLMFNHQRSWSDGSKVANLPNRYVKIKNTEQELSNPETRRNAVKNLHCPCNKAYKRKFIISHRITFSKGFYEDINWSIESVIKAHKIIYTPIIIFNYRQREGSITRRQDDRHFDIFKQFEKTIELFENNKEHKTHYEKEVYEYARLLLIGILNTKYRITKKKEAKFIKLMHELLYCWRKKLGIKKIDFILLAAKTGTPSIYFAINKLRQIYLGLTKT